MFRPAEDFCAACGAIMQPPHELTAGSDHTNFIECVICNAKWPYQTSHGQLLSRFERNFEQRNAVTERGHPERREEEEDVTVEHQCPKCECTVATYTTQQTRSADEGQTVFYQCMRCKHRCIEYS
ncbi:hypothetical protein GPALN_005488 [Globodera pallida]|nr:hypothetical protein GPALN_005488 [Globodera pallida]